MLALGITAPVGSCTEPKIVPDVTCAHEDGRLNSAIIPSNHIAGLVHLRSGRSKLLVVRENFPFAYRMIPPKFATCEQRGGSI
jgi:hypothetical protein